MKKNYLKFLSSESTVFEYYKYSDTYFKCSVSEIKLQEQKNDQGSANDFNGRGGKDEHNNRLNHVYQGSLRENGGGSTLQPNEDSNDASAAAAAAGGRSMIKLRLDERTGLILLLCALIVVVINA